MPRLLIDGTALSRQPKGVGRYTYQLCLQVARNLSPAWEIVIAVSTRELPQFPSDFRASFITLPSASNIRKGLLDIPRLVRRARPDVLLRPMESAGYDYGVPMITVCHDIPALIRGAARQPRGLWRRAADWANERLSVHAMGRSVLVVCNSNFIRDAVTTWYGIAPGKSALGYCGVDPRFYDESSRAQPELVRRRYGAARYVLTFATGDPREGYDLLPEIGRNLKELRTETCLLIAGVRLNAPYAISLRRRFSALGLVEGKDYVLEGFLADDQFADLAALYAAADFYLELSRHEGFGMQLAEAMACGTKCISTGQGALREVGGRYAMGVEMDNVESIATTIAAGYQMGLHMGENVDQVEYTRRFSWDDVGKLVTEHIERLCVTD